MILAFIVIQTSLAIFIVMKVSLFTLLCFMAISSMFYIGLMNYLNKKIYSNSIHELEEVKILHKPFDITFNNKDLGQLGEVIEFLFHKSHELILGLVEKIFSILEQGIILKKKSSAIILSCESIKESIDRSCDQQENVLNSVEEITASVHESAMIAKEDVKKCDELRQIAENIIKCTNLSKAQAQNVMGSFVKLKEVSLTLEDQMIKLKHGSNSIGDVLETIRSIASKTSLLSLNAGIEAARAGEHGKGFMVVAEEIKSLSEKTGSSTETVKNEVINIQKVVNSTILASSITLKSLQDSEIQFQDLNSNLISINDQIDKMDAIIKHVTEDFNSTSLKTQEISTVLQIISVSVSSVSDQLALISQQSSAILNEQIDVQNLSATLINMSSSLEKMEKIYFLNLRLDDHRNWVKKLQSAVNAKNYNIDIALDHTLCKFGKWYFNYKPSVEEKVIFAKIDLPHQKIHQTGRVIIDAIKNKDYSKAQNYFEAQTLPLMKEIEYLFEEYKKIVISIA